MLDLKKVAITGGLSCGKSSVCRILENLGAYVVSADTIVHQLLSFDIPLGQQVVRLLGSDVLVDQKLDRSRIAKIVFRDLKLLQALEELLHPIVYREIDRNYQEQKNKLIPPPLFVAEVPLLFESGGEKKFDATVAVLADEAECLKRFILATGATEKEFINRMARQLSLKDKASLADYVILNKGSPSDLLLATQEIYLKLTQRHQS